MLEYAEDDAWDYIEDAPDLRTSGLCGREPFGLTFLWLSALTNPKGHRESFSLSGSTLVNSSVRRFFALPRHSESGTQRDPSKSRRVRVETRVRHLLHLEKPGTTTTELVGKRKLETEIFDQREEIVHISEGSVSYLTSKPIPGGKKLKKAVVTVVSKDQGWSGYPNDHGTYRNSWTWFELSVGRPSGEEFAERWLGTFMRMANSRNTSSRLRKRPCMRGRRVGKF